MQSTLAIPGVARPPEATLVSSYQKRMLEAFQGPPGGLQDDYFALVRETGDTEAELALQPGASRLLNRPDASRHAWPTG